MKRRHFLAITISVIVVISTITIISVIPEKVYEKRAIILLSNVMASEGLSGIKNAHYVDVGDLFENMFM